MTVDPVKQQVADLAVEFFGAKLARAASGGISGTVPATLSLTLGPAPSFGVRPGRGPQLHRDRHSHRDLERG